MSREPSTCAMVVTVGAGRVDDRTDAEVIEASWGVPDEFGVLHDRHVGALYRYACQRDRKSTRLNSSH